MKDIIHGLMTFIEGLGYWGILIGLMIEVLPSELVLSYGGYLVAQGGITFTGAVIFGTIGCLAQQIILYWIGRYGGRPFVERYGKYIHLKSRYLDIAENWFVKYGPGMVFAARFVPVVRQAISIPAGMARMSMVKFLFYTLLGTIPWAILFVYLGEKLARLGQNWETAGEVAKQYTQPMVWGVIILTILFIVWQLMKRKKQTK